MLQETLHSILDGAGLDAAHLFTSPKVAVKGTLFHHAKKRQLDFLRRDILGELKTACVVCLRRQKLPSVGSESERGIGLKL